MSFTVVPVREADAILGEKNMFRHTIETFHYIDENLTGISQTGEMLRMALNDMNWRRETESLRILDGRRYQYKGLMQRIALEGNLSVYEFILEGLFRLQLGYDKGLIDAGILLLTGKRGAKSMYGETRDLVLSEMTALYPTISLPVLIGLFTLDDTIPETVATEESVYAGHDNL